MLPVLFHPLIYAIDIYSFRARIINTYWIKTNFLSELPELLSECVIFPYERISNGFCFLNQNNHLNANNGRKTPRSTGNSIHHFHAEFFWASIFFPSVFAWHKNQRGTRLRPQQRYWDTFTQDKHPARAFDASDRLVSPACKNFSVFLLQNHSYHALFRANIKVLLKVSSNRWHFRHRFGDVSMVIAEFLLVSFAVW